MQLFNFPHRYFLPCQKHADKLAGISDQIYRTLGQDLRRLRGDQRLAAAQVYLDIMEAVSQASQASKAGELTTKGIRKNVFGVLCCFHLKRNFGTDFHFRTENRVLQLLLAF